MTVLQWQLYGASCAVAWLCSMVFLGMRGLLSSSDRTENAFVVGIVTVLSPGWPAFAALGVLWAVFSGVARLFGRLGP